MPLNSEAPPPLAERLKETAHRRRIMIVAGEASGDLHGGDLAREILARDPSCDLFGIAGEKMRAAGVRAIVKTEDIHGLGLSELASTIGRTIGAFRALRRIIRREKPDLVILIDYAEFNLILSGTARRAGVPVLYYITPQVWAWRRGRINKLVDRAGRLADLDRTVRSALRLPQARRRRAQGLPDPRGQLPGRRRSGRGPGQEIGRAHV